MEQLVGDLFNDTLNDSHKPQEYFLNLFSIDLEETILRHMTRIVSDDGRYLWQCSACEKVHALKHVISDHVEAMHMENVFECPYCHKKKKSRSNLRAHISSYHREEHQMYRIKI